MTTIRCSHHWIIKTPEGSVSIGICKLCGKEKEFINSAETRGNWRIQTREARDRLEKPLEQRVSYYR